MLGGRVFVWWVGVGRGVSDGGLKWWYGFWVCGVLEVGGVYGRGLSIRVGDC